MKCPTCDLTWRGTQHSAKLKKLICVGYQIACVKARESKTRKQQIQSQVSVSADVVLKKKKEQIMDDS